MTTTERPIEHQTQQLERVTIRFAGDSGDGMQLTGSQFTRTAAVFGNAHGRPSRHHSRCQHGRKNPGQDQQAPNSHTPNPVTVPAGFGGSF